MALEWWQKTLIGITSIASVTYAVHSWNESYRILIEEKRNEIHPITKWIANQMNCEEDMRDERILQHYRQLKLADQRLKSINHYFPGQHPNGLDYDFEALERHVAQINAKRKPSLSVWHQIKSLLGFD